MTDTYGLIERQRHHNSVYLFCMGELFGVIADYTDYDTSQHSYIAVPCGSLLGHKTFWYDSFDTAEEDLIAWYWATR